MIYTFRNKRSKKVKEYNISISAYDQFVADNPNLERWIESAPAVAFDGRHFGSLDAQMPGGFKDVLTKIGEANPGSAIADRYAKNKTNAQVKTKELREKHKKLAKKKVEEMTQR